MNKKKLLFALAILYSIGINAQAPLIDWQKSLGGTGSDFAESIDATRDSGVVVLGYSNSSDSDFNTNRGDRDIWVLRFNKKGDLMWKRSLAGSEYEEGKCVKQTSDGGFIVVGGSESSNGDFAFNLGGSDFCVFKLDSLGNIVWHKSFGGDDDDIAESVAQTPDGGYIIAGSTYSDNGDVTDNDGSTDVWLLKIAANGAKEWSTTYGGSRLDMASSVIVTKDSGYAVSAYSRSSDFNLTENKGGTDFWIFKTDKNGLLKWQKSLGGSTDDLSKSIIQTYDGGYMTVGLSSSNDGDITKAFGQDDVWAVKLDETGVIQWQKKFGGASMDMGFGVVQIEDSSYTILGLTNSNAADAGTLKGGYDFWLFNINRVGDIQWSKSFGGSDNEYGYALCRTKDNGYAAAGLGTSKDKDMTKHNGSDDFWVVKWEGKDLPASVKHQNQGLAQDYLIYPNPCFETVFVACDDPSQIQFTLRDVTGRALIVPCDVNKNTIQIQTSSLASGQYLLEILSNRSLNSSTTILYKQ